jgi:TPR repeat protein
MAAAPSAAPSPAASAPPVSTADSTPAPATKEALLRAEMHCDQKDASSCILAARGYELGSAGTSDADKAVKYRKIALTLWISQCDHNSASACATLADMYRVGRGVPQSDKNADALLARTRELCHYNDAPVCHELPSP